MEIGRRRNVDGESSTLTSTNCPGNIGGSGASWVNLIRTYFSWMASMAETVRSRIYFFIDSGLWIRILIAATQMPKSTPGIRQKQMTMQRYEINTNNLHSAIRIFSSYRNRAPRTKMQRNKKGHPLGTKLIPMGAKTQCNGKKTQCNGIKGPTHMGAEKSFPWEHKNHSHGSKESISKE